MAKNATTAASADDTGEIPLSLDEYCTRLSASDRRVELISAFHSDEAAAGRLIDVESAFAGRFDEFTKRPA
jgi:hypothetical protein